MKTITIEWFCYDRQGRTCGRCEDSYRTIQHALEKVVPQLRDLGMTVDLREHRLDDANMEQSNSVRVNGTDIMVLLQERNDIFSYCRSCTEITGTPTECRTFIYRSKAYESVPEEMIIEAILKEAGS